MKSLTYSERDAHIRRLGYASYGVYLKNDLWHRIRGKVFKRKGKKCLLCGEAAFQVHHKVYTKRNLSGKDLKGLVPICDRCHKHVEFDLGQKLCEADALKKYAKALRSKPLRFRKLKIFNPTLSAIFGCKIE